MKWTCIHTISGALAVTAITGCKTPSSRLWSEAATTVPNQSIQSIRIDPDIEGLIDIYLVRADGRLYRQQDFKPSSADFMTEQSLYWSADISRLIANPGLVKLGEGSINVPRDVWLMRRDKLVDVMLELADHNHEIYFNRVFQTYRLTNSGRNILNNLLTGSTAVTALFSGPAAAGVAAGSLVVNSTITEFDAAFFLNQTFEAIDKAVASERARVRREIKVKLVDNNYSIADARSDIEKYSGISSFRAITTILSDASRLKQDDNSIYGAHKAKSINLP